MNKKRVFNIIAIVSIVIFAFSITPITLQNDTYYTVAIGKHILENGIDMKDPFSWHENLPYTYPHWAYDTATYLVYNLGENVGIGGFTAIYIATVMLSMVLGLVVYLVNSKLSKNNVISFIVTLGVLYLLKDYIAARAQLVTFILFALTILFIEDYIETNKKIYLFGLLAISILMVNIHVAVWPFYFVLFLPYIAEAIICWISDNDIYNRIQVWTCKNKIKRLNRKGKKEQAEKVAEELKHIQENHLVVLEGQKKRRNNPYKVKITKEIPIKGLIIIMIISIFTGLLTPLGTTPYTYFPFAPAFYKIDFSEVPALIGCFAMGPAAGAMIELIKIVLHLLISGTSTAGVGDIANFAIGCAFILPAAWIYKAKHSRKSAMIGMASGTVSVAF